MIRGAAKNHEWVTVVVDPEDYGRVLAEIAAGGVAAATTRADRLCAHGCLYNSAISEWLAEQLADQGDAEPPRRRSFAGLLKQ